MPSKSRKIKTKKYKYQDLYSPNKPGAHPRTKIGFANATTARKTLRNIAGMDMTYQKQVVITMYPLTGFDSQTGYADSARNP